jgi:DNA-binding NtrC family response regulator
VASYLLAIDSMSSRRIGVPEDGILQIGRSPDVDIRIESDAVSRAHARLIFSRGRAQIVDLGSHNGTLVNGERIEGALVLTPGDVVTIADTLLILRSTRATKADVLDLEGMCQRIDQEIARARDYDRPFSVAVVALDRPPQHGIERAALAAVRPMDVLCVHGTNLIALLPELDHRASRELGVALVAATGAARAGVASYPDDGGDTHALLAAARAAVGAALPGDLAVPANAAIEHHVGTNRVIVADAAMVKLYDLIRRLARSDIAVLITGETGSGKENAAAALHHWSSRAAAPFVALNCAALQETLAESELFGYERGAFTEAKAAKPGLLERANGGTLFLDEVGDLSLALQAKLLRAIEQKRIMRLGDIREREVDVRIVAATNVDLEAAVGRQQFRQDLLFRLSGATVTIPPLRHRRQEIPLLARMFLDIEATRMSREPLELSDATLALLAQYDFPGNVRELRNAMAFAVATTESSIIHPWNLPQRLTASSEPTVETAEITTQLRFRPIAEELRDLERQRMIEALDACDGTQTRAATALGMPLRTFTLRMRQYGIETRKR